LPGLCSSGAVSFAGRPISPMPLAISGTKLGVAGLFFFKESASYSAATGWGYNGASSGLRSTATGHGAASPGRPGTHYAVHRRVGTHTVAGYVTSISHSTSVFVVAICVLGHGAGFFLNEFVGKRASRSAAGGSSGDGVGSGAEAGTHIDGNRRAIGPVSKASHTVNGLVGMGAGVNAFAGDALIDGALVVIVATAFGHEVSDPVDSQTTLFFAGIFGGAWVQIIAGQVHKGTSYLFFQVVARGTSFSFANGFYINNGLSGLCSSGAVAFAVRPVAPMPLTVFPTELGVADLFFFKDSASNSTTTGFRYDGTSSGLRSTAA